MQFEKGNIYHIYNQGNNRRKIFFNRENYLFFLKKIRTHILPYGDILAYCLMPNHFHLMVLVNETSLDASIWGATQSCAPNKQSCTPNKKMISLNHSLGIILSSYTKAINKEEKSSGSLFRKRTKAECVTCSDEKLSPSFITLNGITKIPLYEYPQICFNYIHQNPVKANLVKKQTDWEFSSAKDYANIRNGTLVSKEIAKEYFL